MSACGVQFWYANAVLNYNIIILQFYYFFAGRSEFWTNNLFCFLTVTAVSTSLLYQKQHVSICILIQALERMVQETSLQDSIPTAATRAERGGTNLTNKT